MKTKAVILNLRVARASDFSNELGGRKYGCMYFQQNHDGSFCNQPYFFHENTDMEVFRDLYYCKQIWVLAGFFDEVEVIDQYIPRTRPLRKFNKADRPCFCKKQTPKSN